MAVWRRAVVRGMMGANEDPAALRLPPQAIEAEQSVLGGLMLDNSAWDRAGDLLTDSDFYRYEHKAIYKAIGDLVANTKPADVITVFEQLQMHGKAEECGGIAYLNALAQSVPSAANLRRYAEIVRERAVLRAVIAEADRVAAAAFKPGATAASVLDDGQAAMSRLAIESQGAGDRRLRLLDLAQLMESAGQATWLVKGAVPATAVGVLFGASGTFKSFVAIDLALHVAHGLPWLGRRTRQGSVIYIAAEGGAGLWPRVWAWHRARGRPWQKAPLHVVREALNLNASAMRVVEAAKAVGVEPALVVVDTLSQTFRGDENSAGDIATYLNALRESFHRLWSCCVLVVHHAGHSAIERPRGSSALIANTDFLLGACRDAEQMLVQLTCVKQKDGEKFVDASFSVTQQALGTDVDGDPITSLVARHLSSIDDVQEALQGEAKAGRLNAYQLLLSLVQNGMRESNLRKAFYEDCGLPNVDAQRQAYTRARGRATKDGQFEVAQGQVIVLKGHS